MSESKSAKHLTACLEQLNNATLWLHRSYEQCQHIDITKPLSAEELDKLENLTSRFARTVDILINKVYRALDALELQEPGSLIDTINRAAKKGLIDSIEEARRLKDIRNEIAHEYVVSNLTNILKEVLTGTTLVFDLVERARKHSEKIR